MTSLNETTTTTTSSVLEQQQRSVSDAHTALDFLFLFAIVCTNCLVAMKIFCLPRWPTRSRHCLAIGLAVGSLIVSLFAYVNRLRADLHNGKSGEITHEMYVTFIALVYYLPFVYGFYLLIFALDVVLSARNKRYARFFFASAATSSSSSSSYRRVVAWNAILSCIPWIGGLVVVLPIVIPNMDWDQCRHNDVTSIYRTSCWLSMTRHRVTLIVCNILPQVLALILAFIVRVTVVRKPSTTEPSAPASSSSTSVEYKYYTPHHATAAASAAEAQAAGSQGMMFTSWNDDPESGSKGKLYNAVTESQTIQSLSGKYNNNSRLNDVAMETKQTSSSSTSTTNGRSGGGGSEIDVFDRMVLFHETNILVVCSAVLFVCNSLWPICQWLETYDSYQAVAGVAMNVTSFYLTQLSFVLVPMVWMCARIMV